MVINIDISKEIIIMIILYKNKVGVYHYLSEGCLKRGFIGFPETEDQSVQIDNVVTQMIQNISS